MAAMRGTPLLRRAGLLWTQRATTSALSSAAVSVAPLSTLPSLSLPSPLLFTPIKSSRNHSIQMRNNFSRHMSSSPLCWQEEGKSEEEVNEPEMFPIIRKFLGDNKVVLFMKGTPAAPMCGFSRAVVQVLNAQGVQDFVGVNVLENEDVRQGIKQFSDWPTIPQLYVNGEFVGGCDIVVDMFKNGELEPLLEEAGVEYSKKEEE